MVRRKKILYIHQLFRHPEEFGGTRSYWIAQELIKSGYQVTMLCQKNPLLFPNEKIPAVSTDNIDGIRVIYIRNRFNKTMSLLKKSFSFLRFMLLSARYAFKEKDVDIVYATSTPLTVAFPALLLWIFKKTPFIFEVRDLWPEVPIKMGGINNKILIKFLKWFEAKTYNSALHVICLSPGMQEGVTRHVPLEKTSMIPNMAKIDAFFPRPVDINTLTKYGLKPDSFKIIHFGAMGIVNWLDYLLNAANILTQKKDSTIEFILLGHGSQKNKLYERILKEKLNNVKIINSLPMKETSELVNASDISFVSVAKIPILEINSANKFFDSLSAGKPIFLNFSGWLREIIERNNIGFFVDPDNPEDFVSKIKHLQENPLKIDIMGKKARVLAENNYDKSILCPEVVAVVNKCLLKK